ncbi:Phosphoribosylaminoimidazole-succinocarboxamide synthase [Granulibacter bethesdensis]|nr:Phosphoribosylaminoimidazole-succinocarboxamide synthase [Granulibacter bethesdensis]
MPYHRPDHHEQEQIHRQMNNRTLPRRPNRRKPGTQPIRMAMTQEQGVTDVSRCPACCYTRRASPGSGGVVRHTVAESHAMARRRQLYEGKAKILFEGPEPGTLVQYFKDDATAGNGAKKGIITGKGVLNNRISEYLMQRLGEIGIPTHFVRRLNMREQLIREVEIIPLEVVVRNVAAGSISSRLGIPEGTRLPRSILEYYYKNDALNDPMVAEEHITAFGWASTTDMDDIVSLTLRVNDFLSGLFLGVGILLVDFKLEFGRLWENEEMRIVLADEISPDNCRLWDAKTNEKMDKDRFRRDLGGVEEAYQEVAKRLGILPEAGSRDMKGPETMQ